MYILLLLVLLHNKINYCLVFTRPTLLPYYESYLYEVG